MQCPPFGGSAAALLVTVATVTACAACASGATDDLNGTSDAGAASSDAGGTTTTLSDTGTTSPLGMDAGAAPDTSYVSAADAGGEDVSHQDASTPDGSTIVADTSTGGPPADAPVEPTDVADTSTPPSTGLSVLYQVQDSATTSAYIGCELSIMNAGTGSPTVSDLKARYYYTDEVHLTPQITINWSHVSTSGADQDLTVTSAVAALVPSATDADTYVEFSFSSNGSPTLSAGESAVFSWQLQSPNPAQDLYTQTNDYSFNAAATTLTSSEHVVLLQSGTVVWGQVP